jgi:hypothetical protein
MRPTLRWTGPLAVLGLLVTAAPGRAQDMPVPVEVQVPLLAKILSFDEARAPSRGPLVLAVVFQSRNRVSAGTAADVLARLAELPGFRVVPIDLDETPDLAAELQRSAVQAVYVSPLRAVPPARVAVVSREHQAVTLTGVPGYVAQGLAVGIELSGERPHLVINLVAARAEGARFSAQLLKLARLVERDPVGR